MPGLAARADQTLICPVPRDGAQRAALRAIVAAAEDRNSFAAVIGAAGSGKTTVLDMAAALLDHPPIQVIRVEAGGQPMSSRRLTEQIAGPTDEEDPAAALEVAQERLLMPAPPCTRTILMIDDAHCLQDDALAYLQFTSGLARAAGLQVVFAARPEFRLLGPSDLLGKLAQRVSMRATLEAPAAAPNQAVVPHREPLRLVPARQAHRWTARQYGVTSALAATVVLASLWPIARDRVHAPPPLHAAAQAATSQAGEASPIEPRAKRLPAPAPPARVRTAAAEPSVNLGPPLIAAVSSGPNGAAGGLVEPAALTAAPETAGPAPATETPPEPAPKASVAAPVSAPPRTERLAAASPAPVAPPQAAPSGKPVAMPKLAQAAPPSPALSADLIAALVSHGDDMLRQGDIGAARLLYARAAEAGSGAAAVAMGKTFDPRFLAEMGAEGIAPDPQTAAAWYRRALALGEHDAAGLLARLSDNPAP